MNNQPGSKILVVDDEPMNIRLLQIRLQAEGYTVLTATNGQEAIEQVKVGKPDLILLDVMMPEMNGFKVCQWIRENESTRFLPVVMVTALIGDDDRIKAIGVGADDFISKPFDHYEVLARVRSLLRIKQYRDALEDANQKLEVHNARLVNELQMAREIQEILIPQNLSSLAGFRVSAHYIPEIDVGGDFFDLWEIEPGKLGVFISDVMGHGVSAAFVTVFIKTVVEEIRSQISDPGQLLETVNARFNRLISSQLFMFTTAFYAEIDLPNETLSCANAGHPFPFIIHSRQGMCEPIGDKDTGKGLGITPNAVYKTHHYPFDRFNGLFLYTDGAYEIQNPQGEEFSTDRLQSVLTHQINERTGVLVDSVLDAINQFNDGSGKDDDITLVAIDADKSTLENR